MGAYNIRNTILLIVAAFSSGLIVAASVGLGPLAYITYKVNVGSSSGDYGITPIYIDLGSLKAGAEGNANDTAYMKTSQAGYYKFELKHSDELKKVFSEFKVSITVGNRSFTLDLYGYKEHKVYLEPGDYTVYVEVYYKVKASPASASVENMPFIRVELEDYS